MERMSTKWYSTFCTHCINNFYTKDGLVRFHYDDVYHDALKKIREGHKEDVNPDLVDLFIKIVDVTQKQCGQVEITESMETALLLALINVQVGYAASSHQLYDIFNG